jgi:hypothetical protein
VLGLVLVFEDIFAIDVQGAPAMRSLGQLDVDVEVEAICALELR